jgi:hypothetical protein
VAPLNLLMIAVGAVVIVAAAWRARGPYLRSEELRTHRDNLARYETWRGGRSPLPERGRDSAELMIVELRRQVRLWLAVGGVGLLLVFLGFWLG